MPGPSFARLYDDVSTLPSGHSRYGSCAFTALARPIAGSIWGARLEGSSSGLSYPYLRVEPEEMKARREQLRWRSSASLIRLLTFVRSGRWFCYLLPGRYSNVPRDKTPLQPRPTTMMLMKLAKLLPTDEMSRVVCRRTSKQGRCK